MSEKAVDSIDLGSWARFTPSLVSFLSNDVDAGARLVFYVERPLLEPDTQLTAPGLANKLLRRKPRSLAISRGLRFWLTKLRAHLATRL